MRRRNKFFPEINSKISGMVLLLSDDRRFLELTEAATCHVPGQLPALGRF
jgi:hypothetical protein